MSGLWGDSAEWEYPSEDSDGPLQENRLRYKSLPGVRASVPYIVLKVKERMGIKR